jgi:hypothetical protein
VLLGSRGEVPGEEKHKKRYEDDDDDDDNDGIKIIGRKT